MRAEYSGPFVESSIQVLSGILGDAPERGPLSLRTQSETKHQINIVCHVTGDVKGIVVYGMSVTVADRLASISSGKSIVTFDQSAAGVLGELFGQIGNRSKLGLQEAGFHCQTTSATIIRGTNVKIADKDWTALAIPLHCGEIGEIEICISLVAESDLAA